MSDEFVEQSLKGGLLDHFYRSTDPDELERLMLAIAKKPMRAGHILHSAGFLERMMVHVTHCMLTSAYGPDEARRFEPSESVRAIAAKVRINYLMHYPLETGVDDLIAEVQDPVIRQNFVEPIAAHTISVVATAKETYDAQPMASEYTPPEDPEEFQT